MNGHEDTGLLCTWRGWGLAIVAGLLAAILLMLLGDWRFVAAVLAGIVIAIILGAIMSWYVCVPREGQSVDTGVAPSPNTRASEEPTDAPSRDVSVEAVSDPAAAPAASSAQQSASKSESKAEAADASADGLVKNSAALAGQSDLSTRKGSWRYEGGDTDAAPAKKSGNKPVKKATKKATEKAAKKPEEKPAEPAASKPAPAQAPAAAGGDVDYDKDGKIEGANEGTRPARLDGPREGGADNLKEIKGIGPKLEVLCNSMGFYHFDQIANWSADEIAWVNANLAGFKGRVSRDDWVAQAKILAAGGDTEFSKRVDDGSVY